MRGRVPGRDHKEGDRHRKDVAREQGLRDVGIECFEVVGGDLGDIDLVVKRMHAARARSLLPRTGRAPLDAGAARPGGRLGQLHAVL